MGWWMKCWGWLNKWGAKAVASAAVSEWRKFKWIQQQAKRWMSWIWWMGAFVEMLNELVMGRRPLCRSTTPFQLIPSISIPAALAVHCSLIKKRRATPIAQQLKNERELNWLVECDGMEEPLGVKLITFHSVIWKSLIFNGGSSGSKPFHPSTNQPLHSNKQKVVCFHCVAEMVDWIPLIIKK